LTDAPKKIAILGTCPTHWHLAPLNDPGWQIWGLSRLFADPRLTRWDVWFEIHRLDEICKSWEAEPAQIEAARRTYFGWLAEQKKPIYVREQTPSIPSGIRYPIEEVLRVFPRGYFTNTVSYMIALAICMKPAEIGVWGVDMAMSDEYAAQRPSVEYFLGVAEGSGIKVTLPQECTLLKTHRLYGLEDPTPLEAGLMAKKKELANRQANYHMQMQQAQGALQGLAGAMEVIRYIEQNWDCGRS
jgi:hypothetical protein